MKRAIASSLLVLGFVTGLSRAALAQDYVVPIEPLSVETAPTPARANQIVSEEPVRINIMPESFFSNTARPETVRPESVRPESVRPETIRSESVRSESVRPEEVRSESVRPEEVRPEEIRPEELTQEEPTQEESISSAAACDVSGFTKATTRDGTTVVLPPGYDQRKTYPALVLLPYTNSTSCRFFNWAFREVYQQSQTPYILILPSGSASRADYSSEGGFEATIERFETSINRNLKTLIPQYKIDPERVSLAGFSFGADLGWALSLRNPTTYHGVLLIDSLCSYRDSRKMRQLAQGDTRYFLIMGQKEANEDYHPMDEVKGLLDQYQIANMSTQFSEASHSEVIETIPMGTYQEAVEFILD
ncbi:MAG: alpha/beta hydrolase-fold protein [Oculatellaceae cyanobacterium Prado106]|jgi:predicted esterase|nr:alpha/beta hydrolase-fold protein [Oculatellaceae cyanobacterium Prado106]